MRVVAENVTPTKTLEENGQLYALCEEMLCNEVFVCRDGGTSGTTPGGTPLDAH